MDTSSITPLIIAFNEEPNIRRTLERLAWAKEIVVVDSGSNDRTLEIAKSFPQVRVVTRPFDTFAGQCNFGLQQIKTGWVLSLDADYVLGDGFSRELESLEQSPTVGGYRAAFRYCIHGRPLRASLYPPRTVLYRRDGAAYQEDGHAHRVVVNGEVRDLQNKIDHDDRKPFSRWISGQARYAQIEARHLAETPVSQLNSRDRLRRRIFIAPMVVFAYTLFVRGVVLDGAPGWYYAIQRLVAELLLSLQLLENKLAGPGEGKVRE